MSMMMFPGAAPPLSSSSGTSSSSSSSANDIPARRSRCLARLAGTRVDVFLRDNVTVTGILSVRGNCAIYPPEWGKHPLTAEELSTAVRYTRGLPAPEDGWRTVVGKRTRKKEEGKFDKFGKLSHDVPMLWLRNAQKRAGGMTPLTSVMHPLVAITWRDIQGISGTLVEEVAGPKKARFQIDNQISANQIASRSGEKILEKWTDDHSAEEADAMEWPSLEPTEEDKQHTWNQFEENSRMFGVKTTYYDGLYTTELNVGEIPEDVQRRAAEIAGEINGGRYKDEDDDEEDEEKKFSAVAGTGAYTRIKKAPIPPPPPPPPIPTAATTTLKPSAVGGVPQTHIVTSIKKPREDLSHHKKEFLIKPSVPSRDRRLPKDNINALNLEPIKPGKKITGTRPGGWKTDKIPNRQETLEEFSQSAQVIQEKMEKKGWTSPSVAGSAPATRENVSSNQPTATRYPPTTNVTTTQAQQNVSVKTQPTPTAAAANTTTTTTTLLTAGGTTSTAPSSSSTNPPPTTQNRREDSFRFNPNANSFTPKGEPPIGEKPPARPLDNYIYQTLKEITSALVHSTASPYALTSWSPRFQVSYIDCLAASPAAYAPYPYNDYAPPPPMVMMKDSPAPAGYYYTPY